MNDADRNESGQASEEARRFYRDNHAASEAPHADETAVTASGSSLGAGRSEPLPEPQPERQPQSAAASPGPKAAAPAAGARPDTAKVDSSLALGETKSQGSEGPHILDQSFSGTYKD